VDKLAGKYPFLNPYNYCANNPVNLIDLDGRDIVLIECTKYNKDGTAYLGKHGQVSKVTEAALSDILNTDEGKTFLSQYAKSGDKIGNYTFKEDGKLSDRTLRIQDISMSEERGQKLPSSDGAITTIEENGKIITTVKIYSLGMDKYDVGETLSHEMQLHGYNVDPTAKGEEKIAANRDHQALKLKNIKHEGYKQYDNIRNQLNKVDPKYNNAFKKAEEHAKYHY
jgi:hypothetical protein